MSMYQKLLKYYLSSEKYFLHFLDWFYETYNYYGECGTEKYKFFTERKQQFEQKELKENGFCVSLSDSKIQEYFTTYFDELQLFAVIFAHWCGLNEKQVNQISDKRTWKRVWEKLDFFIRNPNEDVFNKNITSSPEKCYINKEGIREAILCSGYITVCETGERYKII